MADQPRDGWSKFRDFATGGSLLLIPLVVAGIGYMIDLSTKDRDVRIKTVQIAISVLKEEPDVKDAHDSVLRSWAMDVIDQYSGVPLPPGARKELQIKGLPAGAWFVPDGEVFDLYDALRRKIEEPPSSQKLKPEPEPKR